MASERIYQAGLIKRLKKAFPGCVVLKNDPNYIQGIPDLIVLFEDKWAALEVKQDAKAKHRPNQDHYISTMSEMSYASFVYPENESEVFSELQQSFGMER